MNVKPKIENLKHGDLVLVRQANQKRLAKICTDVQDPCRTGAIWGKYWRKTDELWGAYKMIILKNIIREAGPEDLPKGLR